MEGAGRGGGWGGGLCVCVGRGVYCACAVYLCVRVSSAGGKKKPPEGREVKERNEGKKLQVSTVTARAAKTPPCF